MKLDNMKNFYDKNKGKLKAILLIVPVLALIFGTLIPYLDEHKKPHVTIRDLPADSFRYLDGEPGISAGKTKFFRENGEEIKNLHILFGEKEELNEEEPLDLVLGNDNVTNVIITNYFKNAIQLTNVKFISDNRRLLKEPEFRLDVIDNGDGLVVGIENTGYSDAHNVRINFKLIDTDEADLHLKKYLKNEERLYADIPLIKAGEKVKVPFLTKDDVIENIENISGILGATASCDEIEEEMDVETTGYTIGLPDVTIYGIGGPNLHLSENRYGVKIDKEGQIVRNEKILEYVEPGETMIIPVYFFPMWSCRIQARFEFEYLQGNKTGTIITDPIEVEYIVSENNMQVQDMESE